MNTSIFRQIPCFPLLTLFLLMAFITPGVALAQPENEPPFKLNHIAKNALKKGDHRTAVAYSVQSLINYPTHNKPASKILKDNFASMASSESDKVDRLKEQGAEFRGDSTVLIWQTVIKELKTVEGVISNIDAIPAVVWNDPAYELEKSNYGGDFSASIEEANVQLKWATRLASAMHYARGEELLGRETIEASRTAAKEFKRCLDFTPNHPKADSMYQVSREMGTRRVMILPFQAVGQATEVVQAANSFSDYFLQQIAQANPEFLQFVSAQEVNEAMSTYRGRPSSDADLQALARSVNADYLFTGKIVSVTMKVSEPYVGTEEQTKTITVKETVYPKPTEEDIRNKVTPKPVEVEKNETITAVARVQTTTYTCSLEGNYRIINLANNLNTDPAPLSTSNTYQQVTYKYASGDPRAYKDLSRNELPDVATRSRELANSASARITNSLLAQEASLTIPLITAPTRKLEALNESESVNESESSQNGLND